jgi:iron(III) transport system permease protein
LSGSVGLYLVGKFVFGRAIPGGGSKSTTQAQTRRLGLLGTLGAWALFGGIVLVSLLPHIGVVLLSVTDRWFLTILPERYTMEHLAAVLDAPATYNSIVNSLRYAGLSTAIDIALGSLAAWLIIRARAPLRNALDGLCMLPLAVPGLILAAGYVSITVPGSWLESIGPTRNPFVLLVIAYSVRRLPFVVRGVSAGLQQVPESLEQAARNLGASKLRTAWKITVPLILANVIAAGVLTFSFAMLEVSDSLVLAQKEIDYPITKQIYEMASGQEHELYQAAALGVYGMALLAGTMALATLLLGRRLGAIFRA